MATTPSPGLRPANLIVRPLPADDNRASILPQYSHRPSNSKPSEILVDHSTPTSNWRGYVPYDGYVTPPQIAKTYQVPASTGAGVKIGIIAPLGGGFLQSDLNKSFADLKSNGYFTSSQTAPIINTVLLDGVSGDFNDDPYDANIENTLDIYCIATMAPAAEITIYFGYDFAGLIARAVSDECHILSISYAWPAEPGEPGIDPYWTGEDLEGVFAAAEAANIAICVASGDSGAGRTIDGNVSLGVSYPSSSPQVISVGGTYLELWFPSDNPADFGFKVDDRYYETDDNSDEAFGPSWGGGGGISRVFSRPDFQTGLKYYPEAQNPNWVRSRVDEQGPGEPLTMRGIPDISAPMNGYVMYHNGQPISVGGTSAAAPVMAGILARYQSLTQKQLSSTKYNKLFYSSDLAGFNELPAGLGLGAWLVAGTGTTQVGGIPEGYYGIRGWDPVIGLGSIRGTSFYNSLRSRTRYPKINYGVRQYWGQMWPRPIIWGDTVGIRRPPWNLTA